MRISDWSSDVCSSDLQFLQRVVVQRCLADRMAETQVVGDRARDRTPVAPAHRHVVAQVPAGQRPKQVAGAVDHPQPGEEEMPASTHPQRLVYGYRRPPGKVARRDPRTCENKTEESREGEECVRTCRYRCSP